MKPEHRRPLIAAVAVLLVCAAMIVHAMRTDALVGIGRPMRILAAEVVDPVEPAHPATRDDAPARADAPVVGTPTPTTPAAPPSGSPADAAPSTEPTEPTGHSGARPTQDGQDGQDGQGDHGGTQALGETTGQGSTDHLSEQPSGEASPEPGDGPSGPPDGTWHLSGSASWQAALQDLKGAGTQLAAMLLQQLPDDVRDQVESWLAEHGDAELSPRWEPAPPRR